MYKAPKNTILIVDDESSNILTLTHILSPDYVVYAAKNGQQALQAAQKYLPDIILLDIIMPDMDGYAVLAALKAFEATQDIPVIFVTGLSDAAAEEKGLALGVADYITKPFSAAIVKLRLRNQMLLIEQFRSNEYDIMKYKLANDALNIALWDMDVVSDDPVNPDNEFTWSQEVRSMLGFADENDFPNVLNSWISRLHPEDRERSINAFAAHMNDKTGKTPYNVEYRLMTKNGVYRHFHGFGGTYRDGSGVAVRVAGALADITEEKRMKSEIAEAMAKIEADAYWHKSILDAIPLPITVTDANMKWTFVNKAVEVFLGRKREEMYGNPCSEWNAHICNTENCGIACAKRGIKRTFFNHEESSYQVDVEILRSMEGATAGFIEVVQDITNVQKLARQHAEAETTNRAKSAFLANMSHEIRTPMNAILGITEIMMRSETLPEAIEEGLTKIYSSCNMLLGIINDILDFSKIEAGKLDIQPAEYDVASLINDSVQLNMMKIGGKNIDFELKIDEKIPAKLIGDELRIKQILNNLLSNAFKYTDAGKVTLSAASEKNADGVTLVLSVRDTGHGMTKEQVERLFEEYTRFSEDSNRTIEGTGLGLSITQRLISLMNGEVHVESELGVGSLFTVRLPHSTVNSEVLGKEVVENLQLFRRSEKKKTSQIAWEPMPYGRVLIVDDVEANLYVAVGLMKPYKLQIETAASGYAAIDNIVKAGKKYDIVFMDHMMPKLNGMETTKRLRESGYEAPIVALTANAIAGQVAVFLENGFDDFIAKPIDVHQLHSVICKYVRDKQPAETMEEAVEAEAAMEEAGAHSKAITRLLDEKIEGLDVLKGLERYHNDEELYLNIMRSYVASVCSMLESVSTVSEDGIHDYEIIVHGIKGISLDIYAEEIGKSAMALEHAAKAGNYEYVVLNNPPFIEAAGKLVAELGAVLSEIDAENPKPEKDKPDTGLLLRLLAACIAYDMDGVDDAMAQIDEYQYTSDDGLAVLLRKCVNVMDFQQIIKKLSGFDAG